MSHYESNSINFMGRNKHKNKKNDGAMTVKEAGVQGNERTAEMSSAEFHEQSGKGGSIDSNRIRDLNDIDRKSEEWNR